MKQPTSYIGPHEVYPPHNNFPTYPMDPMIYPNHQTYNAYNPLQPAEYHPSYLPKTLPVDECDSRNVTLEEMLQPKSRQQHDEESFQLLNSGMKTVPKFKYNIDIDHLEQLCNDEVGDSQRRKNEKPSNEHLKTLKSEKPVPLVRGVQVKPSTSVVTKSVKIDNIFLNGALNKRPAPIQDKVDNLASLPAAEEGKLTAGPPIPSRSSHFNGARPKEPNRPPPADNNEAKTAQVSESF